mmetsp:Transcript_21895/g.25301  ORF Transcript_21895/g.25301 Transcript_21895/m.25301 type:complete len:557 (+) Transcript_21895:178-1848(+)
MRLAQTVRRSLLCNIHNRHTSVLSSTRKQSNTRLFASSRAPPTTNTNTNTNTQQKNQYQKSNTKSKSKISYINNSQNGQQRFFYTSALKLSKIYDEETLQQTSSEKEQELIKLKLLSKTGSELAHSNLLQKLDIAIDEMNRNQLLELEGKEEIDDKRIIQSMQNVGKLQWEIGSLDDAQSIQEKILSRQIEYYKSQIKTENSTDNLPNHIDIARTLNMIGTIQSRMNQPQEAKRWFDASLQMKKVLFQDLDWHYEIGKTLNGLALIQIQLEDEDCFGNENETSVVAFGTLPRTAALKLFEEAEYHYIYHDENETADRDDDYVGDSMADHPHVGAINCNMANLYRKHGDYPMAVQKYEEALRIHMLWISEEDLTNNGNGDIVNFHMDIGDCLKALRKYENALERYEKALQLHMIVIRQERRRHTELEHEGNDENIELMNSRGEAVLRHNIGMMYAYLEHHQEAMEEYQASLKIKKALDENHPEVAKTLNGLGALHAAMGNHDAALAHFREALYIFRMHSTAMSGEDDDTDEEVIQTKRNIELVEKQIMTNAFGRGRR